MRFATLPACATSGRLITVNVFNFSTPTYLILVFLKRLVLSRIEFMRICSLTLPSLADLTLYAYYSVITLHAQFHFHDTRFTVESSDTEPRRLVDLWSTALRCTTARPKHWYCSRRNTQLSVITTHVVLWKWMSYNNFTIKQNNSQTEIERWPITTLPQITTDCTEVDTLRGPRNTQKCDEQENKWSILNNSNSVQ